MVGGATVNLTQTLRAKSRVVVDKSTYLHTLLHDFQYEKFATE